MAELRTSDCAGQPGRGGVPAALAILALTAVLSLVWSHVRLMWNDEFLSFYSDSASSLRRVLGIQLHSPISLDPPTYHLLSHLCMNVFGRNGMALRLPALLGFLLLQVCLFVLVRRLAGYRAALVAMLFPLATASFRYSVEGRPYGLLLGLYAAALLCWYTAAASTGVRRMLSLVGLTAAIALAITSHYFGVLILIPVTAGELVRTARRRRFDVPVVVSLFLGLCAVGAIVPFQHALMPYRQHYYTSSVNLHNVSQGYRELFVRYNHWSLPVQHVCAALLLVATVALMIATYRVFQRGQQETVPARVLWSALWAALLAFAALPFCGYLFGRFVTHTMEVRYVIAALVFFAVSLALVLAPYLRRDRVFYGVLSTLLVMAVASAALQIRAEDRASQAILAGLAAPSALHDELSRDPTQRLYTQSLGDFFLDSYYAPDPLLRERMTLVYDEPDEVHYLRHNTNAVTAVYLSRFSPLRVAPWPPVEQSHALLLNYHSGWEWVGDDLRERNVPMQPMGKALGADLLLLNPLNGEASGADHGR